MTPIISAGGVVINNKNEVLVVDQGGSWSLPKGHVKEGEGLMETAEREIFEESGLKTIEYIMNLGNYKRESMDHQEGLKNIFMFLFKTDQNALGPEDKNIKEARWVKRNEVVRVLTHPRDKEFFQKVDPILEL